MRVFGDLLAGDPAGERRLPAPALPGAAVAIGQAAGDDSAIRELLGAGAQAASGSPARPVPPALDASFISRPGTTMAAPLAGTGDDAILASLMGTAATPQVCAVNDDAALNAAMQATGTIGADDAALDSVMREPCAEGIRTSDDVALAEQLRAEERDDAIFKELSSPSGPSALPSAARLARIREDELLKRQDAAMLERALAGARRGAKAGQRAGGGGASAPRPIPRLRRVRPIQILSDGVARGSLIYFASLGDVTMARYFCDRAKRCEDTFLVNTPDHHGRSALHHAAFEGSVEMADVLLQAGADAMQRDSDGRTPLHVSAFRGNVEVSRLMIGTCLYRLRVAAVHHYRSLRFGQAASDGSILAEQNAAQTALSEYLHSLEDLRFNLLESADKFDLACIHYTLEDAFHGCLSVLKLILTCLSEFADPSSTDPVMFDHRFHPQLPPGSTGACRMPNGSRSSVPTLVTWLAGLLPDHRAEHLISEHIRRSRACLDELVGGRDRHGLAPVHYAAAEGNYRAVHVLASLGADVLAQADAGLIEPGTRGLTAFELAKDSTTRQALAGYPKAGASLSQQAASLCRLVDGNCEYVNKEWGLMSRTPLHAALFSAVGSDTAAAPRALTTLLEVHPECDPLVPDANGWTPLHYACAYGRHMELTQLVERLRQLHPSLWDKPEVSHEAKTGILRRPVTNTQQQLDASRFGHMRRTPQPGRFDQPRHRPEAETGRLNLVKPEYASDPKKERATAKRRAKSSGVGGGHDARVAVTNKDVVSSTALGAIMGRTPSHLAAQGACQGEEDTLLDTSPHLVCLAILREEGLLDLEVEDDRGMTPLLAACDAGAATAVQWLLLRKADTYKQDQTKRNALHIATSKSHRRVIRLLCYWDCDTSRLKEGQDWKGRQPIEMFRTGWARGGNGGRGGVGDEMSEDFATFWEAARTGDLDQLQCALRSGTDVDALSPSGWTAAMFAAAGGHTAILKLLLSMKCLCDSPTPPGGEAQPNVVAGPLLRRPDARALRRRGPLHVASEMGHTDICTLLVRSGANKEARSADNFTPLMSACFKGRLEVVRLLVSMGCDAGSDVDSSSPSRNVFHLLAKGNTKEHARCILFIADRLDYYEALDLLEYGDEDAKLLEPVETAKPHSATYYGIMRARKAAQKRSDDDRSPPVSSSRRSSHRSESRRSSRAQSPDSPLSASGGPLSASGGPLSASGGPPGASGGA